MNRSSGNASKTKKLISEATNNSKTNRKSLKILCESSSISSNKNSSAQSEEDVRIAGSRTRQQSNNDASYEEQELLMKKLQGQVKELRHKLKVLEESVESRDYSLGTIAREKDRAIGEIRRLERSNRQLRQQLNDERNHYLEEKERFCEEMTRYKKRLQEMRMAGEKKQSGKWNPVITISQQSLRWQFNKEKGDFAENKAFQLKSSKSQRLSRTREKLSSLGSFSCSESQIRKSGSLESLRLYEGNDQSLQMAALKTENAKLRSIICERDERNYELCLRFLRMKHCKNDIRTRFRDLETEYLQVITNLMEKIDEARQEFNFIIDQKFKRPLHSTNAMYLRLVQRNSRMAFENASLRVENQCLKKELKKHANGISECDRKIEETLAADEQESKQMFCHSKSDSKLKRTKKNVNFKEIRTIYERNLSLRNSDTDTNGMSKATTPAHSNASLTDPKSNESIMRGTTGADESPQNETGLTFEPGSLPDDILNKIFKQIDTSSCQTLNTNKSLDEKPRIKDVSCGDGKTAVLPIETLADDFPEKSYGNARDDTITRKIPVSAVTEQIFHKEIDSSSPCDSKESIRLDIKNNLSLLPYTPGEFVKLAKRMGGMTELERKAYLQPARQSDEIRLKSPHLRRPNRITKHFDLGYDIDVLDHSHQRTRFEKLLQSSPERRLQMKPIKDSCGLEERAEVSYQELPRKAESLIRTPVTFDNQKQSVDKSPANAQKEDGKGKEMGRDDADPVPKDKIKFTSQSGDEPINNTKNHPKNDDGLYGDIKLHSAKTYRIDDSPCEVEESTETKHIAPEPETDVPRLDVMRTRRPEGSKRFSHRLISTSPEQLRSILTDSQLEACCRMAPIIVGHATTEIGSGFQCMDSNNDIVLQLVIPAANVNHSNQVYAENAKSSGRDTLEKETSVSGLEPADVKTYSNLPTEMCPSDIRIPVSNLPTSTSTMDVVDEEALNDRSNIVLRTLSAPGLLESSWLDPYTICEMRDCGTNT